MSEHTTPMPGSIADITAGLDALKDQGFIGDWRREKSKWLVTTGADVGATASFGPYTTREIFGFVEGTRCMGANV